MNEINIPEQFKWWAKMGYSARGIVYLVIGGLAILAALGRGGQTTDSQGALTTILNQPFGNIMLAGLIIGLIGYVLWRFIQATKDTDGHGTTAKGLAIRAGLLTSSATHALLAIWATYLLFGWSNNFTTGSGDLLSSQFGQIVIMLVGVAAIGAGLAHLYKGWTARFERYMAIPTAQQVWARPVCRFGLIARGVVWCIVGWFLISSTLTARQEETQGIADALASLSESGYGPWLLGITATGLFAFGIYSCLEALYRRIDTASA